MTSSRTRALPPALLRRVPIGVHIASVALAFVLLMYLSRRIWFIYDEWEFINRIVTGNLDVFTPHNEHWSTVPVLIYKALFTVFGARTHIPYMATLIILHLVIATELWIVMRRAGADPVVVALLVLVFLFLGAGHDDILWGVLIASNCSLVFGFLQLLAGDHDHGFGVREVAGWLAGVLALMSSGIGLSMLAATAVAALLRRGWRGMLVTASVPAVVYAWWLIAVGRHALGSDHISLNDALQVPSYIWKGLTTSVDGATGLAGAGAVLVLGLLAWVLTRGWPLPRRLVLPVSAGAGSVASFAVIGLARLGSIGSVVPARYIYVAVALLLPLTALALSALSRRGPFLRWGIAGLIILMLIQGAGVLRQQAAGWRATSEGSRIRITGAARLIVTDQALVGAFPDPDGAPNLTTDDLRSMVAHDQIRGETPPTPAAALEVAAFMQVALGPDAHASASPSPLRLVAIEGARQAKLANGCLLLQPSVTAAYVDIRATGPADVTLAPDQATTLTVEVRHVGDGATAPYPRRYDAPAGAVTHLALSNPALSLRLLLATSVTVCGAQY